MGHKDHHEKAAGPVKCFVLTVSDTRTSADDHAGNFIRGALDGAGHHIAGSAIVRDDRHDIKKLLIEDLPHDSQAVIITGGTGISPRDRTVDAVRPLLEVEIPGFGELFRTLSYEEIGPAAFLSRATAGVMLERVIFCIPGSTSAVRLAMQKIILPEISHAVWEANR